MGGGGRRAGVQSAPCPVPPSFGGRNVGSRARSAFSQSKDVLLFSPPCSACLGVHSCTWRHKRATRDAVAHAGSQLLPTRPHLWGALRQTHSDRVNDDRPLGTRAGCTECALPGASQFWGRNVGSRARSAFSHPKDVLLFSPRCSACRKYDSMLEMLRCSCNAQATMKNSSISHQRRCIRRILATLPLSIGMAMLY